MRTLSSSTVAARGNAQLGQPSLHPMPFPQRRHANSLPWLIRIAVVGIFLPYTFGTTGKYVIALLFPVALASLFMATAPGKRSVIICDFFVWFMSLSMIVAEVLATGSLSGSTSSDALAFVGTYTAARAFVWEKKSFGQFIRIFRLVALVLIALSALDTLSGQFVILNLMRDIFRADVAERWLVHGTADLHRDLFGLNIIRATSSFSHPILFGTFCTIAATIFLYSERTVLKRVFYVSACLFGCILSISSAALMGFIFAVSAYCYDRAFEKFRPRWTVLWLVIATLSLAVMLLVDNPLGFVFRHFTFNPETGYYRLFIWQHAFQYIFASPLTGDPTGSAWVSDDILSNSVDCVWLVVALLNGIPTVLFLFLANLSACVRIGRTPKIRTLSPEMQWVIRMRTGLSLALTLFATIGLSVHFWDAIWMFWALCIGLRASLEEYYLFLNRADSGLGRLQ